MTTVCRAWSCAHPGSSRSRTTASRPVRLRRRQRQGQRAAVPADRPVGRRGRARGRRGAGTAARLRPVRGQRHHPVLARRPRRAAAGRPRGRRAARPRLPGVYERLGWRMFPHIDRVYVNARARADLHWEPRYDFGHALELLRNGRGTAQCPCDQRGSEGLPLGDHRAVHDALTERSTRTADRAYCGGDGDDGAASASQAPNCIFSLAGSPVRHGRHPRGDRAALGRGHVRARGPARWPDVGRGPRGHGGHEHAGRDGDPARGPRDPADREPSSGPTPPGSRTGRRS